MTERASGGRGFTERAIPLHRSLAPSGWGEAGRRLRAARLGESPDPDEVAGLVLAFAAARAPLRERRTGRSDLSPATGEVYQREAKRFARWTAAEGVNLLRVTGEELRRYGFERLGAGERAQTVRRAVTIARMVSLALEWTGLDVTPPKAPRIDDPVKPEDKRIPALWADFNRAAASVVAAALASREPLRLRLAAAVLLCGTSGLRASEALGLRWSDLDAARGTVRVRCGKGGRERVSPVTPDGLSVLAALRGEAPSAAPILAGPGGRPLSRQTLWKILGEWERANGLPVGVHVLRHGAATRLASLDGLEAARDLLGHSSTRTTERYAKRAAADALRLRVSASLTLTGEA